MNMRVAAIALSSVSIRRRRQSCAPASPLAGGELVELSARELVEGAHDRGVPIGNRADAAPAGRLARGLEPVVGQVVESCAVSCPSSSNSSSSCSTSDMPSCRSLKMASAASSKISSLSCVVKRPSRMSASAWQNSRCCSFFVRACGRSDVCLRSTSWKAFCGTTETRPYFLRAACSHASVVWSSSSSSTAACAPTYRQAGRDGPTAR